jgi:hypothetical protein
MGMNVQSVAEKVILGQVRGKFRDGPELSSFGTVPEFATDLTHFCHELLDAPDLLLHA